MKTVIVTDQKQQWPFEIPDAAVVTARQYLAEPDSSPEPGVRVLNLWWEEGFAPRRADGFVDAMRDALRAYLAFAGAARLDWAPHLAAEKRLFPARP